MRLAVKALKTQHITRNLSIAVTMQKNTKSSCTFSML